MQLCFEEPELVREYFFALLESLASGILLVNPAGRIQAVNAKAGELLGLSVSSIVQRDCWEVLGQFLQLDAEAADKLKQPGGGLVLERRLPSGEKNMLCLTRSELKSPFQRLRGGFFLRLEDVGGKSVIKAQADRRKRLEAMRELAVNFNQELKTPLGSIELYASLLKRELAEDPDNRRLAEQIMQAVRTMDDLLHNSLIDSSLPAPKKQRMPLKKWLKEVVIRLRELDQQHHYRFRLQIDLGQQEILADHALMSLMAENAGRNAMESMPEGGEIEIGGRMVPDDGGRVLFELRFTDSGCGIAAEHLGQVFDPFYTTKQNAKGMGLPVVHLVAEAHHGLVRIESEQGKGTVLAVLLPVI